MTDLIKDMAPGTSFSARFTWTEDVYRFKVGSRGELYFNVWNTLGQVDRIAEDTIHDVQGPEEDHIEYTELLARLEAVRAVLERAEAENAKHLYPADIEAALNGEKS